MLSKLFTGGIALVDGTPDVELLGMVSGSINYNSKDIDGEGDANLDRVSTAVGECDETIEMESEDCKSILDGIGWDGKKIVSPDVFKLFVPEYDNGGMLKTTGGLWTCALGLAVLKSLSANHADKASIQYMLQSASTDGAIEPLAHTTAQTLPTPTFSNSRYTLGPVVVNGTTLTGVTGINFNTGAVVFAKGSDGTVYPTICAMKSRAAVLTINGTKMDDFATYVGKGLAVTTFAFYLQKCATGGGRVAPATAEHIKISGYLGKISPKSMNTKQAADGSNSFELKPVVDGTHAAVVISTASAIP